MTNEPSPADHYRDLAAKLTATLGAVPTDRWNAPSPCDDWTARDIVQHIVDTQRDIVTRVGLELPTGPLPESDPVGAWIATRDAMQEILDDPARGNLEYDGYFGRTTLAATVDTFYTFDLIVHGWDIARATGLDETITEADLDFVESAAAGMGAAIRMDGVCGPVVDVPEDADRTTRVLAYLGRQA
ncbi:MAG: TIGR03086 family metal-binding protein [Rhodococcus sp. (in: high G+C Gram-positive bacteria)]|uniref:TIGR03086 family metal-binding protein n=1 Tax=Rhodococcus sp. TaxID=1831 RepID=UPI003BB6357B